MTTVQGQPWAPATSFPLFLATPALPLEFPFLRFSLSLQSSQQSPYWPAVFWLQPFLWQEARAMDRQPLPESAHTQSHTQMQVPPGSPLGQASPSPLTRGALGGNETKASHHTPDSSLFFSPAPTPNKRTQSDLQGPGGCLWPRRRLCL